MGLLLIILYGLLLIYIYCGLLIINKQDLLFHHHFWLDHTTDRFQSPFVRTLEKSVLNQLHRSISSIKHAVNYSYMTYLQILCMKRLPARLVFLIFFFLSQRSTKRVCYAYPIYISY
jgi:hypothetical protein